MPPPILPPKQLVTVAVLEGLVVLSAVLRMPFGQADLQRTSHLVWFLAVVMIGALAIAQFVMRTTMLAAKAGGEVDPDARRGVLMVSVVMLVLAGAISALGPRAFELLLGETHRVG